jgi:tripartite-type tricarboxylate transporter receptor subunit TctC
MARLFAKFAEKYFPQPFVIENRPGAGGQIGFEALARAKKDGYTIGTLYTPHVAAHISAKRAKYTLEDFVPLFNFVSDPGVVVVNAASPFKTLEDLVTAAKGKKLNGSTSGPGGDDFFALTQLNEAAGIEIKSVPEKGSSGQKAAVLGGHVDVGFMNWSQIKPNFQSGEIRILGIMTPERLAELPDVPTCLEQGYRVISDSSRGFAAPAGVPEEVLKVLDETFRKVLDDAEFQKAAKEQLEMHVLDGPAYKAYLEELLTVTNKAFEKEPW